MKKGDRISTGFDGKIYEVVGTWEGNLVFASLDPNEDRCLIYSVNDVAELLETGEIARVAK